MNTDALVSIVMPCYNASAYLEDAVISVINQTYTHWELLIVDDASRDNSWEIIQRLKRKETRIKPIRNVTNVGVAEARNRAIRLARGNFIAFLDCDDKWHHKKLEIQLHAMQHRQVGISYTAYHLIDVHNQTLGIFHANKRTTYHEMLKTSVIGTSTMMYNVRRLGKRFFLPIGHEDYAFKLDLLKSEPFALGITQPLAYYRLTKQGLSHNKWRAARWQWRIYRHIEKLSYFKSIYYFIHYVYYGVRKYR